MKNAGRVLNGKEIQGEIIYPEKSIFSMMRKPYRSMKSFYTKGTADVKLAINKLEGLETSGKKAKREKPSISDKLTQFKKQQEGIESNKSIKKGEQEYGR